MPKASMRHGGFEADRMNDDSQIYDQSADWAVPLEDDDPGKVALDPAFVLPRRVAWWADRDRDRPFLTEVGGRSLSYAETVAGIRRWSGLLHRLGVERGDRVLSLLPSSINAPLLWMAASCVG